MTIKRVTQFQTTDGGIFTDARAANKHQQLVDIVSLIGADVLAQLNDAGFVVERAPVKRAPRAPRAPKADA